MAFTAMEFLLLWVHPTMDWFDAINHAFATLATGGFSTKGASIAAFDSVYVDTVITLFHVFSRHQLCDALSGYCAAIPNPFSTIGKPVFTP
ncbi:MAG: potassium transporter TrkG [Fodinibius sp.]|nr:potassium transporter TrkG [Fodinibius sp.]